MRGCSVVSPTWNKPLFYEILRVASWRRSQKFSKCRIEQNERVPFLNLLWESARTARGRIYATLPEPFRLVFQGWGSEDLVSGRAGLTCVHHHLTWHPAGPPTWPQSAGSWPNHRTLNWAITPDIQTEGSVLPSHLCQLHISHWVQTTASPTPQFLPNQWKVMKQFMLIPRFWKFQSPAALGAWPLELNHTG